MRREPNGGSATPRSRTLPMSSCSRMMAVYPFGRSRKIARIRAITPRVNTFGDFERVENRCWRCGSQAGPHRDWPRVRSLLRHDDYHRV